MPALGVFHPSIGSVTIDLGSAPIVVGRGGDGVDFELPWDTMVSRQHGRIRFAHGQVWFHDLNSRNGSWLGSQRLPSREVALPAGSSVTLGTTIFTVLLLEAQPRAVTAVPLQAQAAVPPTAPQEFGTRPRRTGQFAQTGPTEVFGSPLDAAAIARLAEIVKPSAGPPEPSAPEGERLLKAPPLRMRFVGPLQVEVVAKERATLERSWWAGLSRGLLFLPTPRPPALHAEVHVRFETPDGLVHATAKVVEVQGPGSEPPGVRLRIETKDSLRTLEAYVTRAADHLLGAVGLDPASRASSSIDHVLAEARVLLDGCEKNQLYTALSVESSASQAAIEARVVELSGLFSGPFPYAKAAQGTELEHAARILDRLGKLLTDPVRRLEYDLRRGDLRVQERLAKARAGQEPSLAELHQAFCRAFPERAEEARVLTRAAVHAAQTLNFAAAIDNAKRALAIDPFYEDLRVSLASWETAGQRSGEHQR